MICCIHYSLLSFWKLIPVGKWIGLGFKVPSSLGHSGMLWEGLWFCPGAGLAPGTGGATSPRKCASSVLSVCLCLAASAEHPELLLCCPSKPSLAGGSGSRDRGPCGAAPRACRVPVPVGTPGHSGCAATAGTGRGDSECQPSVPGARGTEAWHCQARGAQRVPEAARGAWGAVAPLGDSRAQGGVPCSAQGCVHRAALTEQVLGRVLLVVCILREVVDFLAHSSEGSWGDTRQEMLRSCWPGWAAAQGPSCSTWTLKPSVGLPWGSEGWQELQHLPRRRAAPPASWL